MASDPPRLSTALEEQVDLLAAKWLLESQGDGDPGLPFEAALRRLSEISGVAESAGRPDVASLASGLAATVATAGADRERLFFEGLESLQRAVAAGDTPVPQTEAPARSQTSLACDPELVGDFIMEGREHLRVIEVNVLALERNSADTDAIHATFRAFHSLKGLAGFLEYGAIQQVSHEVETVLDLARNAELAITLAVIDVILKSKDYLSREISGIEQALATGTPAPAAADCEALIADIRGVIARGAAEPPPAAAPHPDAPPAPPDASDPEAAETRGRGETEKSDLRRVAAGSIKVNTAKLDFLVDMVGEMVIAQSLVRHNPDLNTVQSPRLAKSVAQLTRITDEIQKTVMSMRMVPIGHLFQKMARVVRDVSRKAGKRVDLETFGEDTELDRNVVEELSDPLMHMVRNAIDHGIEQPHVRRAAGKSETGRLTLRASHQAGYMVVEVADDGAGIQSEKVLAKAVARGVVASGQGLSDADIFDLIFEPGFSTAERVTDISGRGVGLDVVKRSLQKLRGRVEVRSTAGGGSVFVARVPLTLAIIEGLVVTVGHERYIVPMFAVKEIVRPSGDAVGTIENRYEMAVMRGRVLPVVRLNRPFGISGAAQNLTDGLFVVTESRGKDFCLAVDAVLGKQEVVIKSLGDSLKDVPGIAGGAILGDGRVALILDIDGVIRGRAGSARESAPARTVDA